MTRILFRCDASLSIGSGHVIRCRTLARSLKQRGAEVLFLCRRQPGDLISLLEKEFQVLSLPEQPLSVCEGLEGRDLYLAWLGCSQEQDAEASLMVLSSAGVSCLDWLVVDHYGLDADWESQVLLELTKDAPCRLLVIDDLADRTHQADLLLDQNFFGVDTSCRYQDLVPGQCRQFLGPHYALLGPEYAQLHPLVPVRAQLSRVLVFFGGVDPDNLTTRALEALTHKNLEHLSVDVVLGRQSPHRKFVEGLAAQRPRTTLHTALPSLAGLIARADLAIGAGGATTWERACLKLPSLVVTIAANQRPFAEALDQASHLQLLGDAATVTVEEIRSALLSRVSASVEHYQDAGGDLTDGFGASRLTFAMMGAEEPITLRPADADDESLLMRWRTYPLGRAGGTSIDPIAIAVDQNSTSQSLPDSSRFLFIASSRDGCPLGQIGFERQPHTAEGGAGVAVVDFSLDRCVREFGLESELVRLGLQAMEQTLGSRIDVAPDHSDACFIRAALEQNPLSPRILDNSRFQSLSLPSSRLTLLSDRGSWLNDYLPELIQALWAKGHAVRWIHSPTQLVAGDVCLLLSCSRLLSSNQLDLHRHNLVVHESDLPLGQGWSPMTWQILEGTSCIPITLFEATAKLDAGPIYLQKQIELTGQELVDEWRAIQAQATLELCLAWIDRYKDIVAAARPQTGEPSHYRRRRPADSQLDPERSLVDQFNLLRVVDNQKYPAFFDYRGRSFRIHILRKDGDNS